MWTFRTRVELACSSSMEILSCLADHLLTKGLCSTFYTVSSHCIVYELFIIGRCPSRFIFHLMAYHDVILLFAFFFVKIPILFHHGRTWFFVLHMKVFFRFVATRSKENGFSSVFTIERCILESFFLTEVRSSSCLIEL